MSTQPEPKRLCGATIVNYARYTAPVSCHNKATRERGGRWYCGCHDPVNREKARERALASRRFSR